MHACSTHSRPMRPTGLRKALAIAGATAAVLAGHGLVFPAGGAVTRAGDRWIIENQRIRVEVSPHVGRFQVRDKEARITWRSAPFVGPFAASAKPRPLRALAGPAPIIDGDLGDWSGPWDVRITHSMLADARRVDSDADCSARIRFRYAPDALYLAAWVTDDVLRFPKPGAEKWWEKDSVELWVDSVQIGLNLDPKAGCAVRSTARLFPEAAAAVRVVRDARDGKGYIVEARLPWSIFGRGAPRPGERLRLAIGVNDADDAGTREGQIYFPKTWRHSDPATFAEFAAADAEGRIPPRELKAQGSAFRNVTTRRNPDGIRFEVFLRTPQRLTVLVEMTVPPDEADLIIRLDTPDPDVKLRRWFRALPPLVPDVAEPALAVADYCNGHLYPLDLNPFPKTFFNANRLDMPWLGFVDMQTGAGFALIIDTSDDCGVRLREVRVDSGRKLRAPFLEWWASFRTFRYPRQFRYRFRARGGYVALAKAYRKFAQKRRLLKPLAEKAKKNPNVKRLFGAPDVWGDASLAFARRAKALGVDKMLIHGTSPPDDMGRINELGYLTSRYDNYTDILPVKPGEPVSNNRGHIPDDVVLRADGKRQTAWLTFDKKTQYMKRCPALWLDVAKQVIPPDIARYPYLGRFIDVTTAEGLYECFDPRHPLTRTDKRHCGEDLEKYVWDLGLVGGGEHGIWWGVRWMCYIEGMMSGGFYSWPAGHLRHPKTKEDHVGNPWGRKLPPFSMYEKFGVGHKYRVPLWELVFHDCIVSTWYWGDASDWLLDAAPEVTPKKDAFNILYGTIPLLWANREGSWHKDRSVFLRTYRNTCKLHEQIAGEEMLIHEFVTPDRDVQRTVFSSGTEVVVNFGAEPREVTLKNEHFVLPQNGFVVRGPKIRQSLTLEDGKTVTLIETPGYFYEERDGAGAALQHVGAGRIRVLAAPWPKPVLLHPERVAPDWTKDRWLLYRLGEDGARTELAGSARSGSEVRVGAARDFTTYELLYAGAAERPDVTVEAGPNEARRFTAIVRNRGFADVAVRCAFYVDRVRSDRRIGPAQIVRLPGGGRREVQLPAMDEPTARLVGCHRLVLMAETMPPAADLNPRDNAAAVSVRRLPDSKFWDGRVSIEASAGPVDRTGQVLQFKLDLNALARTARTDAPPDPASIRIAQTTDGKEPDLPLLCEFGLAPKSRTENTTGVLYWLPEGEFPAGAVRRFDILFKTGRSRIWPPLGDHWDAATNTVRMPTYILRFVNGSPAELRPVTKGRPGPNFLESIIYSSRQTGWAEETDSDVQSIHCLADGPVRCVVRVVKRLRGGVRSTKTYSFYPDHFEIEATVDPPKHPGILCRVHFRLPGTYFDDKGISAEVDGQGPENHATYGKNRKPKWFAVSGKGWALTAVALDAFDHVAYWDGPHMGAVGFTGPRRLPARMAFVVHDRTIPRDAAARDYTRLATPPAVRIMNQAAGR